MNFIEDDDEELRRPLRLPVMQPPLVRMRRSIDAVSDNNLGQSIDVTYGERRRVLLDARGLDPGGETVTCVVTYHVQGERRAADDLRGLRLGVEFGVGGTSHLVEMDLVHGLAFTVPATTLRLLVDYPAQEGGTGPLLQVRAAMVYGSLGSVAGAPPTARLTVPLGRLDRGAESPIVAVPTLSTAVSVTSSVATAWPTLFVRQHRSPLTPSVLAEQALSTDPILLVNGAQGISVVHTGLQATDVSALFLLAL